MTTDRVAVGVVLDLFGRVLLGKKVTDPSHPFSDLWHLPGGKANDGEDDHAALRREIAEEAGLSDLTIGWMIAESVTDHGAIRWFRCFTKDFEPIAGDDLVEARFVTMTTAERMVSPAVYSGWPDDVRSNVFGYDSALIGASA